MNDGIMTYEGLNAQSHKDTRFIKEIQVVQVPIRPESLVVNRSRPSQFHRVKSAFKAWFAYPILFSLT